MLKSKRRYIDLGEKQIFFSVLKIESILKKTNSKLKMNKYIRILLESHQYIKT